MTRERRNEIAYQFSKLFFRQETSFQNMANAKRDIGNFLKEKEMAHVSKEEFLEFWKIISREVFENLIAGLV